MKNKKILYLLIGAGILILVILFVIYTNLFSTGVTPVKKNQVIYIPTGSSYNQVLDSLKSNLTIKNLKVLKWIAKKKKLPG